MVRFITLAHNDVEWPDLKPNWYLSDSVYLTTLCKITHSNNLVSTLDKAIAR